MILRYFSIFLMISICGSAFGKECVTVVECAQEMVKVANELRSENQAIREKNERLTAQISTLENRKLDCFTSITEGKPSNADIIDLEYRTARTDINAGYKVTGGGCVAEMKPRENPIQRSFITDNRPLKDDAGWYCRARHAPNAGAPRRLIVYATMCKI